MASCKVLKIDFELLTEGVCSELDLYRLLHCFNSLGESENFTTSIGLTINLIGNFK